MKAIAISEMSSGSVWSSDHSAWPYNSKRSQNMFHPVNPPSDDCYKPRKSQVSRSLFGPSDPSESHRIACEEFNSRRYSDRSRWNFDFYKEKSMPGRYDWRKVTTNDKDRKYAPGDSMADSLWSSKKSPKKCFLEDNFTNLKRTTGSTWTNDGLISNRHIESKKKGY